MVSGAYLVVLMYMADMTGVDVYGQISLPMHGTDAPMLLMR